MVELGPHPTALVHGNPEYFGKTRDDWYQYMYMSISPYIAK